MTHPRVCHDRILPRDLRRAQPAIVGPSGRLQAVAPIQRQWPNGSVLTVAFMGGTEADRANVRGILPEWSRHANVRFEFVAAPPAAIRVSFDPNDGAWSYLGTDAQEIPQNQATLNLGWVERDVILHEFGHALSLAHEHQNPQGGIRWNEAAVIADLSGPPNYWDRETIQHNVLDKYAIDQVHASAFDPASVMLYSFPKEWTLDGFSAPWNQDISAGDAAFVASEKMYPPTSTEPPVEAKKLRLVLAQAALITRGGVVEFQFEAPQLGDYNFQTAGALDVVLAVYRGAALVAQDDDSGGARQAHVRARLSTGTYRVVVRCYDAAQAGKARVIAWA